MKLFWCLIAVLVCLGIYWLIVWHDNHPDGE